MNMTGAKNAELAILRGEKLRIRQALDRLTVMVDVTLTKEPDLTPYKAAKWLLYRLAKQDAVESVREELTRINAELKRVRAAKGTNVREWVSKKGERRAPLIGRAELLEHLLEERNDWMARTLEHDMGEEQELAADDRDCFYDEDMWELGCEYDPDFSKPIIDWAKIDADAL